MQTKDVTKGACHTWPLDPASLTCCLCLPGPHQRGSAQNVVGSYSLGLLEGECCWPAHAFTPFELDALSSAGLTLSGLVLAAIKFKTADLV